jgi:serine protease Do
MIHFPSHRLSARVRVAAATISLLVWCSSPLVAQRNPVPRAPAAPSLDGLDAMNQAIDALTRKVWPSVVQIMVTGYGARDEHGRGEVTAVVTRQRSVGSGFVIDPEGYIMTNAHVVSGAQRVQVILPPLNADGTLGSALSQKSTVLPARIVGITTEIDLALLKVEGLKAPALPLATYRDVRQGETVFAFGSPGGLRNTLTHGLISAVARQADPDSPLIYVQTDAPINPGNSGGPLVNVRGEVVGVNTFIMSQSGGNEGLGFAVPSATARTVYRQLKKYGQLRRQEIGMSIQTITHTMAASLGLAREYGVIVSDVWPQGPAEAAGLKVGDILLSVDDQPAENLPTVNYFFRLREADTPVDLVVLSGGHPKSIKVTPMEQKGELDSVSLTTDPEKNLVAPLGILGVEIDPALAARATGLRDYYGIVVVARVTGAIGDVPLLPRDIIRSLNNERTATLAGLRQLLQALKPGAPVTLQVQREGRLMYVSFTVE